MIEFNFLENPNRIHIDFSKNINYPIDVFFTSPSGKVIWQTSLSYPSWVEGPPGLKETDIRVIDNNGDLIFSHNWTFNSNSDIVEKEFIIDDESEKLKLSERLKKHNFNIAVGEEYNTCAFK